MPVTTVKNADPLAKTVTIPTSGSLSPVVELVGATLVGIQIPSGWTTANITFQASADGSTYVDLYDNSGAEYTVVVGGTSRYIAVPLGDLLGVRFLKVRSGTSGTPVSQTVARILTLALAP